MAEVFVRGFDFSTTQDDLLMHCTDAGGSSVLAIKMLGKGSAIVTYGNAAEAQQAALQLQGSVVPGNTRYLEAKINEQRGSAPGGPRASGARAPVPSRAHQPMPTAVPAGPYPVNISAYGGVHAGASGGPGCNALVGNIDGSVTVQMLRDHFAFVGQVLSVQFCARSSAVLTFASPAQADAAVALLNNSMMPGNRRPLQVQPEQAVTGQLPGGLPGPVPVAAVPTPWTHQGVKQAATVPLAAVPSGVRRRVREREETRPFKKGRYSDATPESAAPTNEVFICGFDFGTHEEVLRLHCGQVGAVESVQLCGGGAAIVRFVDVDDARRAVEILQRTVMEGNTRYIDVKPFGGSQEGVGHRGPGKRRGGQEPAATDGPSSADGVKGEPEERSEPVAEQAVKGQTEGSQPAAWGDYLAEAWRIFRDVTDPNRRTLGNFLAGMPPELRAEMRTRPGP